MTKVAQLCHVKPILKKDKIQQVCVESQPTALNMTLPAFAAEHGA